MEFRRWSGYPIEFHWFFITFTGIYLNATSECVVWPIDGFCGVVTIIESKIFFSHAYRTLVYTHWHWYSTKLLAAITKLRAARAWGALWQIRVVSVINLLASRSRLAGFYAMVYEFGHNSRMQRILVFILEIEYWRFLSSRAKKVLSYNYTLWPLFVCYLAICGFNSLLILNLVKIVLRSLCMDGNENQSIVKLSNEYILPHSP